MHVEEFIVIFMDTLKSLITSVRGKRQAEQKPTGLYVPSYSYINTLILITKAVHSNSILIIYCNKVSLVQVTKIVQTVIHSKDFYIMHS